MAANKKIIGRRIMIKHKKRDFKFPRGDFQGLFKARYSPRPIEGVDCNIARGDSYTLRVRRES